jgi:3D (Asp-Asp-Asp) domain-containing protein
MRASWMMMVMGVAACSPSSGPRWAGEAPEPPRHAAADTWLGAPASTSAPGSPAGDPDVIVVQELGGTPRAILSAGNEELFRNTYYDFPREGAGAKDATVFDATCAPIARVTRRFHDQVCVQGSGRLGTGETVSFARRDCACAAVCPRTSQKICFERLDPARFPHGRGAAGSPITPMRSVAVDVTVIPLGTRIFVPEYAGLPRPDGSTHDGCFIAEDRGLKVVGRHIDLFTGDPSFTSQWNALVPSNLGVHVRMNDPHCTSR